MWYQDQVHRYQALIPKQVDLWSIVKLGGSLSVLLNSRTILLDPPIFWTVWTGIRILTGGSMVGGSTLDIIDPPRFWGSKSDYFKGPKRVAPAAVNYLPSLRAEFLKFINKIKSYLGKTERVDLFDDPFKFHFCKHTSPGTQELWFPGSFPRGLHEQTPADR